jgi:hypothetical protein
MTGLPKSIRAKSSPVANPNAFPRGRTFLCTELSLLRHQAGLSRVFCSCLAFTVQHYYNLTRLAPPTRSDLHGLCSGSTLSKAALIRYLHCRLQQQTAMVGSVWVLR